MPRSQISAAKDMIYPEVKKTNNTFHKSNLESIKKQQVENKIKKEEKENYVPRKFKLNLAEPYKLKEFKAVPSKLSQLVINI